MRALARISGGMKDISIGKAAALALAVAGVGMLAGCASVTGGGTAALPDSSGVQGRDLGRGGATTGGVSSLSGGGNAADWSVYDARQEAKTGG